MHVLLIDGHPDKNRLSGHLLDHYQAALPERATVTRIAVRDIEFDPNLRHGYAKRTEWEPSLVELAGKLDACDHLVLAFPMWWGAEPAELKGLIDRLFLPGFAFKYHDNDAWWDRLLEGRSSDVIITMDTPAIFLRFAYGNAILKRWKKQILEFCGFKPARILVCSPIRQGGVEKKLDKWSAKIAHMARSIKQANPNAKQNRLDAFLRGTTDS
jgi:NAD(P)H dehydrogenase (quinone)